jgi:hypothetical protein
MRIPAGPKMAADVLLQSLTDRLLREPGGQPAAPLLTGLGSESERAATVSPFPKQEAVAWRRQRPDLG